VPPHAIAQQAPHFAHERGARSGGVRRAAESRQAPVVALGLALLEHRAALDDLDDLFAATFSPFELGHARASVSRTGCARADESRSWPTETSVAYRYRYLGAVSWAAASLPARRSRVRSISAWVRPSPKPLNPSGVVADAPIHAHVELVEDHSRGPEIDREALDLLRAGEEQGAFDELLLQAGDREQRVGEATELLLAAVADVGAVVVRQLEHMVELTGDGDGLEPSRAEVLGRERQPGIGCEVGVAGHARGVAVLVGQEPLQAAAAAAAVGSLGEALQIFRAAHPAGSFVAQRLGLVKPSCGARAHGGGPHHAEDQHAHRDKHLHDGRGWQT
jgi:hypothetical protein